MKYLLTIAIPTYNRAKLLSRQLALLENEQLAKNIQVLVSNNCSSEDYNPIKIKNYNFDLKYVEQQKNVGLDGNIYSCYQKAEGEYIWFLSDDDLISPGATKIVINAIKNHSDISVFTFSFSEKFDINCQSNGYQKFKNIDDEGASENFFSVIMISTLVLKKINLEDFVTDELPHTVFPQITLAIRVLNSQFGLMKSSEIIIKREPGYKTKNLFRLYCINPRLAIKNAAVKKFTDKLLPFTEKFLTKFILIAIFLRMGIYLSEKKYNIQELKSAQIEYGHNFTATIKLYLVLIIMNTPKNIIYFLYLIEKIFINKSISKGFNELKKIKNKSFEISKITKISDV